MLRLIQHNDSVCSLPTLRLDLLLPLLIVTGFYSWNLCRHRLSQASILGTCAENK
jgi:hypothetical protein